MKRDLIVERDPKSPITETFKILRTNIQFMSANKKLKSLLVTSTFPGEGKSWISSNLAIAFAQSGKKVVIVDADMRKGRQYSIFNVSPIPGLSNYLSGIDENNNEVENPNLDRYIEKTEIENLYVMPAGNIPPNPSELLISSQMVKLLDKMQQKFDLVIIDGTPCDLVTDSVILSRIVNSTIIVTSYKETKKENLGKIIKNIKNVGGNIAGIVFNKIPITAKRYQSTYYYGSIPEEGKKNRKNSKKKGKSTRNRYENSQDDIKNNYDEFDYQENDKEYLNDNYEEKYQDEYEDKEEKNYSIQEDEEINKIQFMDTKNNSKKQEENEEKYSDDTLENDLNTKEKELESEEYDRTADILKQINEYLNKEKSGLNAEKKKGEDTK